MQIRMRAHDLVQNMAPIWTEAKFNDLTQN